MTTVMRENAHCHNNRILLMICTGEETGHYWICDVLKFTQLCCGKQGLDMEVLLINEAHKDTMLESEESFEIMPSKSFARIKKLRPRELAVLITSGIRLHFLSFCLVGHTGLDIWI